MTVKARRTSTMAVACAILLSLASPLTLGAAHHDSSNPFDVKEWKLQYRKRFQDDHPVVKTIQSRVIALGAASERWRPLAKSSADLQEAIRHAWVSESANFDVYDIASVINVESQFKETAVSPAGAKGLMQLMPQTARAHGVRNVFDPKQNIEGGVKHLEMIRDSGTSPKSKAETFRRYNGSGPVARQYKKDVIRMTQYLKSGNLTEILRSNRVLPSRVTAVKPASAKKHGSVSQLAPINLLDELT